MDLIGPSGTRRSQRRTWIAAIGILLIGICASITQRARTPVVHPVAQAKPAPATVMPRVFYPRFNAPTLTLADGQNRRVFSMLNVRHKMKFGEYIWNDKGVADGETWIMVDVTRQTMSVFRAGHEIGSAPILYGADNKPTPSGVFPILQKARTHRSNLYDAEMPFMLRLSWDGVAIHASNVQSGQATHGCIGVPPAFARLIFDHVGLGDLVSVTKA